MAGEDTHLAFARPKLWRLPFLVYSSVCILWFCTLCATITLSHIDIPYKDAYVLPLSVCALTSVLVFLYVLDRFMRYLVTHFYGVLDEKSVPYRIGKMFVSFKIQFWLSCLITIFSVLLISSR